MKPLRNGWSTLQHRMASAQRVILFLDFDGTLAPMASHPSRARLAVRTRRLLNRLAAHPTVSVVLISGRALTNLKTMAPIHGAYYIGNHGLELEGPGLRLRNSVAWRSRAALMRIATQLERALQAIPGAWVEDKALTLSVHWRRVLSAARRRFHRLVVQQTMPAVRRGLIRLTRGKHVVEIRPPVDWGKGEAVAWLLAQITRLGDARTSFIVYCGDDRTDEGAFQVVNRAGGVSIYVGTRSCQSAACYRLQNVRAVGAWLDALEQALRPLDRRGKESSMRGWVNRRKRGHARRS